MPRIGMSFALKGHLRLGLMAYRTMLENVPWDSEETKWLTVLCFGAGLAVVAWIVFVIFDAVFKRVVARSPGLKILRDACYRPASWIPPLLMLDFVLYGAPDQLSHMMMARQIVTVLLVISVTWLLASAVGAAGDAVVAMRPAVDVADNLAARRLQTQTKILTRSVMSLVILIGLAMALMTFPNVRHIGASILASAGLAGIVAGLAARPLLGNLIAGLQIGLTQPIRLDDVVIVEGEWGRIEEITGTYVVVKIWDQRRMVVPLEWWTQNPFQNWTRSSSAIIGTVFLWVDYRMPLAPLRDELKRLCEGTALWDKAVCLLQVTDVSERSMQLRCLVSAADSGANWDLRCLVREGLLTYIQNNHPEYLPRVRMDAVVETSAPHEGGAPVTGSQAAAVSPTGAPHA
jgi:small-conductance mechanosensitive channel